MSTIEILVQNRALTIPCPGNRYTGTTVDRLHFALDEEWMEYDKIQVFLVCQRGDPIAVPLDSDMSCKLPAVFEKGPVEIGLCAEKGLERLTSGIARLEIERGFFIADDIEELPESQKKDFWQRVESALGLKQDKEDKSLNTSTKTVVGAINEINAGFRPLSFAEIDELLQ